MTTYYVSAVTGSDKNRGDADHPFKTISQAAALAGPGDTVLVREGVYRERVAPAWGGREDAPVTYRAETPGKVIIKGSDVYTGTWEAAGGLYAASLKGMSFTDDWYWDDANPFKVDARGRPEGFHYNFDVPRSGEGTYTLGQVFVKGKPYKQMLYKDHAQGEKGTWWYDAAANTVYVHFKDGEGTGDFIEFTTRRRIFAPHKQNLGYIHVEGFIMEHCGNQFPLYFWEGKETAQAGALGLRSGHHWVIRNNVIRYAAGIGLDCGAEGRPGSERTDGRDYLWAQVWNIIEDNYFIDNGASGVAGWGSWNMVFRNNVVMHNNRRRYQDLMAEHAGIKFHAIMDCLIADNYIAENYHYGVWLDNQYSHTRVTGNVIYRNSYIGLDIEMGRYEPGTVLVDHNIIMDNGNNNTYNQDASGALYVNNIIGSSSTSDYWKGKPQTGFEHVEPAGTLIWTVTDRTPSDNNAYYNNIYVGNPVHFYVPYPSSNSAKGQRFLGNLYDKDERGLWRINNQTWNPVMSSSAFDDAVAARLGVDAGALTTTGTGTNRQALLTFAEWKTFWSSFWTGDEPRSDEDAVIMNGLAADYEPATQTLRVTLPALPATLDNTRWDAPYKLVFSRPLYGADPFGGAEETQVYPGPFESLRAGENVVQVWRGLTPVAEDQLPVLANTRFNSPAPQQAENTNLEVSKTITGITIAKPPNKTIYEQHGGFDTTGLVVEAVYDDGSHENVTDRIGFSSLWRMDILGIQTVTIHFEGWSANYLIQVVPVETGQ
ncbi:hypothetical protein FACS189444_2190 [Spirochaetia bacterium]|nr:hypothetical protein FACS189444_2190 [Spirochaetia bacterium]